MADRIAIRKPAAMLGHAAMLGFSILIAGSFSLGSMIANEIDPAALNAVRFGVASLLMGALAFATVGVPRSALAAPWRYLVLGATFNLYFVLMFVGLKTAPPVSAAAVFTLTPVMAAGFGWILLRQVTTRWMALALSVGAAGALWVIFRADISALLAFEVGRGEKIYAVGCAAHAAFAPMLRLMNRGEHSIVFTFLFMTGGFLLLVVWAWPELCATDWTALRPLVWVTIVYLAVFASAGSFFLLQYGARVLPAAKVMAYGYLTPTWVLVWEIALGHGVPPIFTLVGIGLTLLALAMLLQER